MGSFKLPLLNLSHLQLPLTMNNIRDIAPKAQEPATNAGRFLAKRGIVVMKEFKDFGKLRCDYGTTLTISTLIFAIVQREAGERTFGIKMEHENPESYDESCLLDFDELKELLLAIKYLLKLSKETANKPCDYTEFQYISRDELKFGYFQESTGRQQPFIDVSPGGGMMFITFEQLKTIFNMVKAGRDHLIEKGAGAGISPSA